MANFMLGLQQMRSIQAEASPPLRLVHDIFVDRIVQRKGTALHVHKEYTLLIDIESWQIVPNFDRFNLPKRSQF